MTRRPPHPGDPWHPDWTADLEDDGGGFGGGDAESSVTDFDRLRSGDDAVEEFPAGETERPEVPASAGDTAVDDEDAVTGEIPIPVVPAVSAAGEDGVGNATHRDDGEDDVSLHDDVTGTGEQVVAADEAAPLPEEAGSDEASAAPEYAAGRPGEGSEPAPDPLEDSSRQTIVPTGGVDEEPDDVMWDDLAAALIQTDDTDSWDDWDVGGGLQPISEEVTGQEDPRETTATGEQAGENDAGGGIVVPEAAPSSHSRRRWWHRKPTSDAADGAETAGPEHEPPPAVVPRVEIVEEPATGEIPVVSPAAVPVPPAPGPAAIDGAADEQPALAAPQSQVEAPVPIDEEPATDEVPLPTGFGGIDDLTEEAFVALSTMEHRGLADAVAEGEGDGTAVQALAAPMPGIDTGLLGFEDVVGKLAEEEVAAVRTKPRRQYSNLVARIATGLVLAVVVVVAVWAGASAVAALATVVFLLALGEYYAVLVKSGYRPLSLFGLLGGAGALLGTRVWGLVAVPGALVVTALIVFFFFALAPSRNEPLVNGALTVGGTAWVGGLGAFVMPLLDATDFRLLVFSIVAVTGFMDIAQYFAGKSWGYRRIAPILSPNKTLAGLVGGGAIVVAMGVALGNVEPFDTKTGLILAGAIVVAGPLGDLAVSAFKRAIGVKDMGGILPGHGGVLDRVDALLFAFPAGWLVFRWLGYLM
ncbi:MAG: phosphatidate cytidylyltransferase [Acidimicrobiia bacterium]